jgi:uncharacterized membrane protein YkvA (DUF1232 family)
MAHDENPTDGQGLGSTDQKHQKKLESADVKFVNAGARKITDADVEKVVDKAEEIKSKFNPKGPLARFFEDGRLLISIVKDYWNGNYRKIPFMAIAAIVFTLLYVLNPWDLIPDFLPLIGQIDDAAVVTICLVLVEQELHTYKAWKVEPEA